MLPRPAAVHERLAGAGSRRSARRFWPRRFDDGSELRLGWQHPTRLFRRRHDDQPVPLGEPVVGQRVDFAQRDLGDEAPVKRELLPDRRQRFALEEVARVFVCAAGRLTIGALLDHAFGTGHVRLLRSVELGGGEAERRDALQFGHQGVEASRHAVVRDQRLQRRLVSRPWRRKEATAGGGPQERRLLA